MYLTHTSVIWGFEQRTRLPEAVRAVAALAVVVLLGTLIYIGIEKPLARWRRRLSAVQKA
jgi:peptidoglycan/LPS O-acetylase OafA/YrhL